MRPSVTVLWTRSQLGWAATKSWYRCSELGYQHGDADAVLKFAFNTASNSSACSKMRQKIRREAEN